MYYPLFSSSILVNKGADKKTYQETRALKDDFSVFYEGKFERIFF